MVAVDRFQRAQQEFLRLKTSLAVGRIKPAEFNAALERLTVQDDQGRHWRIAADGGTWLVYDGKQWVGAAPPAYADAPAPRRYSSGLVIAVLGAIIVLVFAMVIAGLAFGQGAVQVALGATATPTASMTPRPTVAPPATSTPIPHSSPTPVATTAPLATLALPATRTAVPTFTATVTATPTNTRAPRPGAIPTGPVPLPPNITIQHDDGVSAEDLDLVQKAAALAYDYQGDAGKVQILLYKNLDTLIEENARIRGVPSDSPDIVASKQAFANLQAHAMGELPAILIWAEGGWKSLVAEAKWRTIAHEYAHILQSFRTRKTSLTNASPHWLIEGVARYSEFQFSDMYGLNNLKDSRQRMIAGARAYRDPLVASESSDGNSREGVSSQYYLGYHAVEFLVNTFGEEAVLRRYWEAVANANTWRDAFRSAFGITTDDFYRQFESYRRAQFPPLCGPVRTEPEDVFGGALAIQFNSQQAPGWDTYDEAFTQPPNVPYVFCVRGVDLMSVKELETKFTMPEGYAGIKTPSGSLLILYMKPSSETKMNTLVLDLGSGRRAETQFLTGPATLGGVPALHPIPTIAVQP